jgi:glycosyltransferase involved in cell wall biosynthesis
MTVKHSIDVLIPISERASDTARLHERYASALRSDGVEAKFIYVLDGEFEASKDALTKLCTENSNIFVVQLSRRFGEASAIMAGYALSTAERILILPAYDQVDPEGLGEFVSCLDDADVVVARRWPRIDSRLNRIQTAVFGWLTRLASGTAYRDLGCGIRALRREVLAEHALYGDQHRFLPILAEMAGYRVVEKDLPQAIEDRERGLQTPGNYLRRFLDLLTVFFLTRFTNRPLRFFGTVGAASCLLGALLLAIIIVQRALGTALADRPALLLSSLMIALGLQVFAVGLVGELLVFIHARSIKKYKVREILEARTATAKKTDEHVSKASSAV